MLDTKRIKVVEDTDGDEQVKIVNEHSGDNETPRYRSRDFLNALRQGGRLSQQQMDEAVQVAHKSAMATELGSVLEFGDHILVDLSTLRTIAEQGLLDIASEAFDRVSISTEDQERLIQELRGFGLAIETQAWHEDLWKMLDNDDRVDAKTLVIYSDDDDLEQGDEKQQDEPKHIVAIDAGLLAQQEKLPLLVDDRVCQNMVLASNGHESSSAFGTDCLLIGMLDAGFIDKREAAVAFLQLIEWRYRFLLVPASILQTIANEFAERDLRNVARYVHDCMRDPGLFGGPEPTEPPIPIAFRYYQDWLQEIANFAAEIWLDDDIDEKRATELTNWAMMELVPTVPTVLGARIGRLADFSAFTVLHHAMIKLCDTPNYPKANTALRSIAGGLALSEDDFIRVAADVINCHG